MSSWTDNSSWHLRKGRVSGHARFFFNYAVVVKGQDVQKLYSCSKHLSQHFLQYEKSQIAYSNYYGHAIVAACMVYAMCGEIETYYFS